MLLNDIKKTKKLATDGVELFGSPALKYFLYNTVTKENFRSDDRSLLHYADLDDFDITGAVKVWQTHDDKVLSMLSKNIIGRKLFKIELQKEPFEPAVIANKLSAAAKAFDLSLEEAGYLVLSQSVDNRAYNLEDDGIKILMKSGEVKDAAAVSDHLNLAALSQSVHKYFLAYPRF